MGSELTNSLIVNTIKALQSLPMGWPAAQTDLHCRLLFLPAVWPFDGPFSGGLLDALPFPLLT